MDIIQEIAFNFDACHMARLADGFGISEKDAHHILGILQGCFNTHGSFIRPTFEGRIGIMAQYNNVIFEILWCFLKETPRRQDRLDFLNALQLLMDKLDSPKRATQFLLADICQHPEKVDFTDRNAFSLANILLHQENKELYIDINRTPESVLNSTRRINREVRDYVHWRLEVDNVRMLAKLQTIHRTFQTSLEATNDEKGPFEIPFLMALEREALIFFAIVGGHTARTYLREMLSDFGNPESEIYAHALKKNQLSEVMAQLHIVVRALGRAGNSEDGQRLQSLQAREDAFDDLDQHPAHDVRVRQAMKCIAETVKKIHSRR